MRYSEVLKSFYKIQLTEDICDLCDTWFTGAAHHLWRFRESQTEEHKLFHARLSRLHIRLMMALVQKKGSFTDAIDPTGKGLNRRESWNYSERILPDFRMFERMVPDSNYPVGHPHPSDHFLYDPDTLGVFQESSCAKRFIS